MTSVAKTGRLLRVDWVERVFRRVRCGMPRSIPPRMDKSPSFPMVGVTRSRDYSENAEAPLTSAGVEDKKALMIFDVTVCVTGPRR